jgi:hypothetical protein
VAKTRKEKAGLASLMRRIRERYKAMAEADQENRRKAMDDLKFVNVPGEQWEQNQKTERGERPCYEFNKVRPTIKRVVNEMRRNRPQGKVRAVEDGDKDTADVYEGLCRNIWNVSDADTVIDYAGEYQVGGGMGAWRITTEYADDSAFDQDIRIEAIKNPFCLYADPSCTDPIKRDARDWILTEKISKSSFEARYPNAKPVSFEDTEFDDDEDWEDGENTRIAEYWYKEPYEKELWLLKTGETVDSESDEAQAIAELVKTDPSIISKRRIVKCHKIMMCVVGGGDKFLEEPSVQAGTQHRFIQIYGDWLVIDGKVYWSGLTRHAKDAQRSYNLAQTATIETIAMAPQAKWIATPKQLLGHMEKWGEAHKKNYPVLVYNADPAAPGPPQRLGGAEVPVALIQQSQIASEQIKEVTGVWDARETESAVQSGKAILARQNQGEVATYNYADNMAKGIRRTWEVLLDLIPEIYDTERVVRILGPDGAEKYKRINQTVAGPNGEPITINDLSKGKYDVAITTGPSFSTQRQEAAESYMQLAQAFPPLMQMAGDYILKASDLPYANEIADRLKAMLPPQIQALEQENQDPKAMMAQAAQLMQQVDEKGQLVQAAEAELKDLESSAKSDQANAKLAAADLEAKRKDLEHAQAELDRTLASIEEQERLALERIAHAEEVLSLKEQLANSRIKMAHQTAEHSLEAAGRDQDDANDETQRAVGDQIKDATHQQQLREAKASSKDKPA